MGLEPANPEAAAVGVAADHSSDIVYVDFGLARTTWELPHESRNPRDYSKEFLLAELREMSVAVIKGKCEEEHKFLRTTGRIFAPDHTYSLTNSPKFRSFRGIKRYQSYCQEAPNDFCA